MKRRSFLTMLGLAPIAAVAPALASVSSKRSSADGSFVIDHENGDMRIATTNVGTVEFGNIDDELKEYQAWVGKETRILIEQSRNAH